MLVYLEQNYGFTAQVSIGENWYFILFAYLRISTDTEKKVENKRFFKRYFKGCPLQSLITTSRCNLTPRFLPNHTARQGAPVLRYWTHEVFA